MTRCAGRIFVNGVSTGSSGGIGVLHGLGAALLDAMPGCVELAVPGVALPRMPGLQGREGVRSLPTMGLGQRLWWEQRTLPMLARRARADVLLGLTNTLPVPRRGLAGRSAVLIQNVAPLVPGVRSAYRGVGRARLEALRALTVASVRRADVTFLFTDWGRELVARAVPGRRVVAIPAGLDPAPDAPARAGDRPYVLVVADLYRYKGVEDAIRALTTHALRDHELRICGAPSDPEYVARLRRLADRLAVAERVRFLGSVSREEVFGQLRGATCLIHPSRLESLALPVLEALQCGTPVVAADIPIVRESGGDLVRLYPAGDVTGLADSCRATAGGVADPGWVTRISTWGRDRSWSRTAASLLRELL
jgi:glycosyltransferase involved in cell wall biosynthesis